MKRKIITYSPALYSFISFVINLIFFSLIFGFWFFILRKTAIWLAIYSGLSFIGLCWFLFWFSKLQNFYSFWRFFYTNSATATSQVFINLHNEQKTKGNAKGFKLIKIFGTFTSWFWLILLVYRKNKNVTKVIEGFKKFTSLNEKIYRLIDLEDFLDKIPPIEIEYTLVII